MVKKGRGKKELQEGEYMRGREGEAWGRAPPGPVSTIYGVWWVSPALTDGDRKMSISQSWHCREEMGRGIRAAAGVVVSVAWCPVSSNGTSVRSF